MTDTDDWDESAIREQAERYLYAARTAQRCVIERFLLAVIDKHPVEGGDREKRLLDAKHALLGTEKRGRGKIDDSGLLMEMARRFAEIQGEDGEEAVSIRKLASDAAALRPGHSAESTAERIRKKFEDACLREAEAPRSGLRHLSPLGHGLMLQDEYGLPEDDTWDESGMQELLNALALKDRVPPNEPGEY
jgi:hypothetical protein